MKLIKVLLASLLCFSLAACAKEEEKETPMEEIDYRLENAGYTVNQTLDPKGKIIGMNIKKKDFTLIFTEVEDKLDNVTFINKERHQYTIDLTKKEARVIMAYKNQLCTFDVDGDKTEKNPKECGEIKKEDITAIRTDFSNFLKEIDIDFDELTAYYTWNTTEIG